MGSYAMKLIEITESHAATIAQQWYNNVRMNPRTPTYNKMPEEQAKNQALYFYNNFGKLFVSDNPFEEANVLFSKYAEARYKERIPLPEVIYAVILMRRHMWLYASSQAVFTSAVDHHQAAESQSRTILMFDYAAYTIVQKYDELLRKEIADTLKSSKVKSPFAAWMGGKT